MVAAGVGLQDSQPETININVPGNVVQALLYWGGAVTNNSASDGSILVDGGAVNGTLIGGPAYFFTSGAKDFYYSNYRADITGLVASGANSFAIDGLDNKDGDGNGENSGAGILVIYDDGSGTSEIGVRDGLDLAFAGFPEPRKSTIAQTYNFASASEDRVAQLVIFAGSVGENRTSTIALTTNAGDIPDLVNVLSSNDGNLWDTINADITIPAGATSLTMEAISDGAAAASFNWINGTLSVPPPGGEGCTPGFWRNHLEDWGPTGLDPSDDFDSTFGVDLFNPNITLDDAINAKGGGDKKLARHGTAALLNALHPEVSYPLTEAQVIAAVQAGNVDDLVDFNELLAPGFCD